MARHEAAVASVKGHAQARGLLGGLELLANLQVSLLLASAR